MHKGITNVSPLTALVAKTITAMVHLDKDEDGQVNTQEWLTAAQFLFFEGLAAIQGINFKEVSAEIKDLDKDEIAELINIFSMNHDLKDDELEFIIEDGIVLLASVSDFVQRVGNWKDGRTTAGISVPPMQRLLIADSLRGMAQARYLSPVKRV